MYIIDEETHRNRLSRMTREGWSPILRISIKETTTFNHPLFLVIKREAADAVEEEVKLKDTY